MGSSLTVSTPVTDKSCIVHSNGYVDGYRPERYDSILASAEISKQTLETFKQNVLTEHKGFVGSCNYVQYQFPSLGDVPTHAKCMDLLANDSFHIDNETWRMQEPLEVGSEPSLPEEETKFSTMGRSQLPYPLSLFDSFPKVPSSIDLDRLIHICDIEFISQTPFLSASHLSLTSHKFAPSSYLIFAKALMATLVSRDAGHRHWARSLYHAASKLFVAAVELDNRISRSLSWYQAVSICLK